MIPQLDNVPTARCWSLTITMAPSIASLMRGRTAAKRYTFGLVVIAGACAANAAQALDDQATLEQKITVCASCHGADGNSTREGMPSLAGQPEMFLIDQLILIREGVRRSELIRPWVRGFDDATIIAIAKHFSALRPRANHGPADPGLFTRGRALAAAGPRSRASPGNAKTIWRRRSGLTATARRSGPTRP